MGLPGIDEYKIWQTDEENVRSAAQEIARLRSGQMRLDKY